MTADKIDQTADALSELFRPHIVAAIDAHKQETLDKVRWPVTELLDKHWHCFEESIPNMFATALRAVLHQIGDSKL